MSNSTACMTPILSWVRRTVKIVTILVTGATRNIGRRITRGTAGHAPAEGLLKGRVAELTGSPAATISQWAERNAELFL